MAQKVSLDAVVREQLRRAKTARNGRSAATVVDGHEHALRQTVIAMTAGTVLAEHANPGEATLQVLHGRVRLVAGDTAWDGRTGDLIAIPNAMHRLEALEEAAVLLTAVPRGGPRPT